MHSPTTGSDGGSSQPNAGDKQTYSMMAADPERDRQAILDCWNEGLTHGGQPEAKFDWYYLRHADGVPEVHFLRHADHAEAVGVAGVSARPMRYGSESVAVGEIVDFVVSPKHRTLFPAIFLQREINRLGMEKRELLYGLPNKQSEAVLRRVGYKLVGQMVRRVRVLRSAEYLARHIPAWTAKLAGPLIDRVRAAAVSLRRLWTGGFRSQWQDKADARFDDLWQRAVMPGTLVGVRDSKFLNWRFADCPLGKYAFLTVCTAVGQLVAYAVCEVQQQGLHVHDFLVDPNARGAWTRLWLDLAHEAFSKGGTTLSTEFLGSDAMQAELQAQGLLAREQRPFYVIASDNWADRLQAQHWYVTAADEDG
ncbi:MAG: hypothetical protein JNN20_17930 [Betaproteobacteria bacterium]|nr:hypothetical protein [Betaproteobacteria bacterium]